MRPWADSSGVRRGHRCLPLDCSCNVRRGPKSRKIINVCLIANYEALQDLQRLISQGWSSSFSTGGMNVVFQNRQTTEIRNLRGAAHPSHADDRLVNVSMGRNCQKADQSLQRDGLYRRIYRSRRWRIGIVSRIRSPRQ